MQFDIFFSICQTPVDGYCPSEAKMFENFFEQVRWADQLGFGCAWVAETHLSCQVQKQNRNAVIPHFEGEIGLNTDILQLAHVIMAQTQKIHVGSAIRNIQCNGGPIAHAEAIRMFCSIQDYLLQKSKTSRRLEIGFAAGRFPFSNTPYGVKPRNEFEEVVWPVLRGKIFLESTEIFLRLLKGEVLSSKEIQPKIIRRSDFRSDEAWKKAQAEFSKLAASSVGHQIRRTDTESFWVSPLWEFETLGIVPREAPMQNLRLTIGSHDLPSQRLANSILPVGVFNLSITPAAEIEETHLRMQEIYRTQQWGASLSNWNRSLMPRTVLVFIDQDSKKAHLRAEAAIANYWKAMEGTLDPDKVAKAVENALVGTPAEIRTQVKARFHSDDRLMLWFDFNDHDSERVKSSMKMFFEDVASYFNVESPI